jgi:probable HAF family extracellular repeat protein
VLTDLGTLPGNTESYAVAINDRGEIAGISLTFLGPSHLVIWRDGTIHDLGVLPAGNANVTDMNNRRQIVGYATSSSGEQAFTWHDGVVTYLPPLTEGGSSVAWAINDRGEIAGASYTPGGELHSVLWRDGVAIDLGTLPGSGVCQAEGLNDRGQVVGWCAIHATATLSAFVWEDGEMTAIGALPGGNYSLASAINDRGVIVGASLDATGTSLRPTMWIPVHGQGR